MISSITNITDSLPSMPSSTQIFSNLKKISMVAVPLIAMSSIQTASAGMSSYLACAATCTSMAAAAAHTGLSAYTYEACMQSCLWMLSPACP